MTTKPDVEDDSVTAEDLVTHVGPIVGFSDEHIELIKNIPSVMAFFVELCEKTEDVLMSEDFDEFKIQFWLEMTNSTKKDPKSLPKRQLFGCYLDVIKKDIEDGRYPPKEKKLTEEILVKYEILFDKTDPWVNYENKKYRLSRFCMMKKTGCQVVRMPTTGEYLATDKKKLENGISRSEMPMKAEKLAGVDDHDDKKIPPGFRGKQHTEMDEIVTKMMVAKIMEDGEKKEEEPSVDPKAEEMNEKEKEDFKLDIVNEEGSSVAATT